MPAPNSRPRKKGRSQRSGPHRSQVQAAAVRAAQTHEDVFAVQSSEDEPEALEAQPDAPPRRRSGVRPVATRGRSSVAAKPLANVHRVTREQEYAFIRADLRRLLVTAGSLAVVMVVLLFVIEM